MFDRRHILRRFRLAGLAVMGGLAVVGAVCAQPSPSYENLHSIVSQYGFPPPGSQGTSLTLQGPESSLVFEANSRRVLCNGVIVWMTEPVLFETNTWLLCQSDTGKILDLLLGCPDLPCAASGFRVLLDPGHGGPDFGAKKDTNTCEKVYVLDIANRVRLKLVAAELEARLTRSDDTFLTLQDRSRIAREWQADVFVSIHINSAENTNALGIETYLLTSAPASSKPSKNHSSSSNACAEDASIVLAYHIHRSLLASTDAPDRGIRNAKFGVLKSAPCPAILVECGFLSNSQEQTKLAEENYRESLAEGMASGIITYVTRLRLR